MDIIHRGPPKNKEKQAPPPGKEELDSVDDHTRNAKMTSGGGIMGKLGCMNSTRMMVLVVLCLQNSLFTVLRRYSQGVLRENYSKYEVLLVGEVVKMAFSAYMIRKALEDKATFQDRLKYLAQTSRKMAGLALIYGAMNILSFVSLRNIGAGLFTIIA